AAREDDDVEIRRSDGFEEVAAVRVRGGAAEADRWVPHFEHRIGNRRARAVDADALAACPCREDVLRLAAQTDAEERPDGLRRRLDRALGHGLVSIGV